MSSSTHTQIPGIGRHDRCVTGMEGAVFVSQALDHDSGEVGASSQLPTVAIFSSNGQEVPIV